jgi:hypothetical protein
MHVAVAHQVHFDAKKICPYLANEAGVMEIDHNSISGLSNLLHVGGLITSNRSAEGGVESVKRSSPILG